MRIRHRRLNHIIVEFTVDSCNGLQLLRLRSKYEGLVGNQHEAKHADIRVLATYLRQKNYNLDSARPHSSLHRNACVKKEVWS